jgi:hypothetical protein
MCVCMREKDHDSTNITNYGTFCTKILQSYTKHLFQIKQTFLDPKLYKLSKVQISYFHFAFAFLEDPIFEDEDPLFEYEDPFFEDEVEDPFFKDEDPFL